MFSSLPIIHTYAAHFLTLGRYEPAAVMLQSWQGGHLSSTAQELATLSMLKCGSQIGLLPLPVPSPAPRPRRSRPDSMAPSPFSGTSPPNPVYLPFGAAVRFGPPDPLPSLLARLPSAL